jgi:hypothetical protein
VGKHKRAPSLGARIESQGEAATRFASFHRMSLLTLIGSRLGTISPSHAQDGSIPARSKEHLGKKAGYRSVLRLQFLRGSRARIRREGR